MSLQEVETSWPWLWLITVSSRPSGTGAVLRAVSTSSTPAPALWKSCACSAKRTGRGKTGLTPHSWKRCGEMPSSGRVSGFLRHKKTGGGKWKMEVTNKIEGEELQIPTVLTSACRGNLWSVGYGFIRKDKKWTVTMKITRCQWNELWTDNKQTKVHSGTTGQTTGIYLPDYEWVSGMRNRGVKYINGFNFEVMAGEDTGIQSGMDFRKKKKKIIKY